MGALSFSTDDHLHSDAPLPLSNHQADRAGLPGDH